MENCFKFMSILFNSSYYSLFSRNKFFKGKKSAKSNKTNTHVANATLSDHIG